MNYAIPEKSLLNSFKGVKTDNALEYTNKEILAALFALEKAIMKSPAIVWPDPTFSVDLHSIFSEYICEKFFPKSDTRVFVHKCNGNEKLLSVDHIPLIMGYHNWLDMQEKLLNADNVRMVPNLKKRVLNIINREMDLRLSGYKK